MPSPPPPPPLQPHLLAAAAATAPPASPVPARLLNEIRGQEVVLKKSFPEESDEPDGRERVVSETFMRGGLLNEIKKGKQLRKTDRPAKDASAPSNATMARGGLFHELRSKRPAVPANDGSTKHASAMYAQPIVATPPHPPSSRGASVEHERNTVLKAGYLHKRAQNGIWQRRYFVLTPATLYYAGSEPRKGASIEDSRDVTRMPMSEIHDVHPTGTGSEFCLLHIERRLRLRAPALGEASQWVTALIGAVLEMHRDQL